MTTKVIHYKIKDEATGLFSCGGFYPCRFNKRGKVWTSLGALRNHLRLVINRGWGEPDRAIPESWVVVELEVVTSPIADRPASEYLKAKTD